MNCSQFLRWLTFCLLLCATPQWSAAAPRKKRRTSFFRHSVTLRQADLPQGSVSARVSVSPQRDFNLQPAGYTPYDSYLAPVRQVLARTPSRPKSLSTASQLLKTAHNFRYVPRHPYRADLPSITASRKSGDCKAKALWLYDRLGDTSALYVIGKVSSSARSAHAWLYWRYNGRWWILDPTNRNVPIAADSVPRSRYVPYYSFSRAGSFRHPATHLLLFAKNSSASVVAEKRSK